MSSATALADAGVRAVLAGHYTEGIEKLTAALKERNAPLWYLERSKAYLRIDRFDLALHDAEMALHIAFERANRDQMVEAQLRRAIALFRMGHFADADVCAFWAGQLADGARAMEDDGQQRKLDGNGDYAVHVKEVQGEAKLKKGSGLNTALNSNAVRQKTVSLQSQAITWRLQALTRMEQLPAGHDGRKVRYAIAKYPDPSQTKREESNPTSEADTKSAVGDASRSSSDVDAWENIWKKYHTMYSTQKVRCSFYQTEPKVTVDVFVKNLTPQLVAVDFESKAVRISPAPGASLGAFGGSILFLPYGEIVPEASTYVVKSMKIELVLQKRTPGKWPVLRRGDSGIVDNLYFNPSESVDLSQFHGFVRRLGYQDVDELQLPNFDDDPSRWYVDLLDKLRSSIEKQQPGSDTTIPASSGATLSPQPKIEAVAIDSSAEKPAAPSAPRVPPPQTSNKAPAYPTSSKKGPKDWDHIDDEDDEDAAKEGDVNAFFQQIYKGADEDTKRAMMKSFVESNGTALSTSWDDAKSKTYKTQPPEGAEAKKWE